MRIPQVQRHPAETAGTDVGDGRVDAHVGRIRLGGGRQVDRRFGEGDAPFRHADERHGVGSGDRDGEGLRVGEADVFGRGDHQTPGDEARVLPASIMRAR